MTFLKCTPCVFGGVCGVGSHLTCREFCWRCVTWLPFATPFVIALFHRVAFPTSPAAFCDMCRIHIPCILPKLNGSRNCCHGLNVVWLCQPVSQPGMQVLTVPRSTRTPRQRAAWLNVVIVFFLIWSLIIYKRRVYSLLAEQFVTNRIRDCWGIISYDIVLYFNIFG